MGRSDRISLEEALRNLENFVTILEKQTDRADLGSSVQEGIEIMFFQADEGGLLLNREEAEEYRRCLDALSTSRLSSKRKGIHVDERYSRKNVERLMQEAIFKALDIKRKRSKEPFEQRLKNAIKELRAALATEPKRWMVHMPIGGLALDSPPQRFGKVEFYIASESRIEKLKQSIAVVDSRSGTLERKQVAKSCSSQMIDLLRNSPMASVEVRAGDPRAALSLARRELCLTMDAINFYSGILFPPGFCMQQYPVGEVQPVKELSVVVGLDTPSYNFFYNTVGPLGGISFSEIDPETAKKLGFCRVSEILAKDNRSEVEERILAALQWAGRATVDKRPEEAFLHYAIALECATLGRKDNVELTYRLSMRTALLVGNTPDDRLEIKKKVRDLYDIRSKIVHSGHYEVADSDLSLIRYYAKRCIIRILTEKPFLSMEKEKDLNAWFEEALLS